MTDKSWEDCVNAVCVKGRPGRLDGLGQDWEAVFRNASSVTQSLRDGIADLKAHWKGAAADDYFGRIEAIAKSIEKIENDNKGIIQLLYQARDALRVAQTTMPVPDYMLDEVQGRQDQLDAANDASARALVGSSLAVETFGLSYVGAYFLPDSFVQPLANSFIADWGREAFGWFSSKLDDWDDSMTNQARDIYNTADKAYANGAAVTPSPTPAHSFQQASINPLNLNPGGPGPGASPFGLHPGASNLDPRLGTDPSAGPGFDPLGDPTDDPTKFGTGLSGAGGGGFTGAGGGPGGFGSAGGAGLGSSGALSAASGALGGAAGVGRPVSPPSMAPPMGGMGPMMGAGAGRGGRTGTTGRGGMVGGGPGTGRGDGDERSSWLTEDEDIWGGSDGAPPGVLK